MTQQPTPETQAQKETRERREREAQAIPAKHLPTPKVVMFKGIRL